MRKEKLSFEFEEEMYPVIADFLKVKGYTVRINTIKFDLLKGWYIDVAGLIEKEPNSEIVAVEAKKDIGPEHVLQAISQAEMYQRVCTNVYVAFPQKYMDLKENKEHVQSIREICHRKGIGILKVGKVCEEFLPPARSRFRVDLYEDVINQFGSSIDEFEGFQPEDFIHFVWGYESERSLTKNKFKLLVKLIEEELSSYNLKLDQKFQFKGIFRGGWWGYLSEEEKQVYVPHYNFGINDEGFNVGVEIFSKTAVNRTIQNLKTDTEKFAMILKGLKSFRVKIWRRVPTRKARDFNSYQICTLYARYADEDMVKLILRELQRFRFTAIWCGFTYDIYDKKLRNKKLVYDIFHKVQTLLPYYEFVSGEPF